MVYFLRELKYAVVNFKNVRSFLAEEMVKNNMFSEAKIGILKNFLA